MLQTDIFLNDTLQKAGFNPQEDDFDLLRADLEPVLKERVIIKILSAIPSQESKDEVMRMLDEGKEKEALIIAESVIPNYEDILGDIFQEFQDEYVASME